MQGPWGVIPGGFAPFNTAKYKDKERGYGTMAFTDVDATWNSWDAISYVVDANLMGGYPDGSFQPNNTVSVAEMAKIISLFLNAGKEIPSMPSENKKDKYRENSWAVHYIDYCVRNGIPLDFFEGEIDQPVDNEKLEEIFVALEKYLNISNESIHRHFKEAVRAPTREDIAILLYDFAKFFSGEVMKLIDNGQCDDALQRIKKFQICVLLLPSEIRRICQHLFAKNRKNENILFKYMLRIRACKKTAFSLSTEIQTVLHYTSLHALEHLTKPGAKFQLSHVSHLNDPEEGSFGLKEAVDIFKGETYKKLRENWKEKKVRSVFVSSFSIADNGRRTEDLPMWVHYGDQGKGCIIQFQVTSLEPEIYKVCYQPKNNSSTSPFQRYIESVKGILDEYIENNSPSLRKNDDVVLLFAKESIEQASYLYKSKYYSYEHEARVLHMKSLTEANEREEIRAGEYFPRLYTELDNSLEIKSITLGPKVKNPEHIIAALIKRGINSNNIYHSKVVYR